jgi:hypothetical protein
MSTPEVTTKVPASVVFELCEDYLQSLEKAKEQTTTNFYKFYLKETKFSLIKMKRIPEYSSAEALERAKNTANLNLHTYGQKAEVIKIKNLAFRDLSATMQVNHEAWNIIHKRFAAVQMENAYLEDF